MTRAFFITLAAACLLVGSAERADARVCAGGRSSQAATAMSAVHAGLGEWYLKGWGPLERAPQNKFWLGWIPVYGWPYLAVRSAIDASRCRTLDRAY
jgi:hypothetical protein